MSEPKVGQRAKYIGDNPTYYGLVGIVTQLMEDGCYLRMDIERVQVENITCLITETLLMPSC